MADLGATHWRWDSDVLEIVSMVLDTFDGVTANTYEDHPFPGWDGRSVDFWGMWGRGSPLGFTTAARIRRMLMVIPGRPYIRHTILRHRIWTSWGGYSFWTPDDHAGDLQHLHVTYWP